MKKPRDPEASLEIHVHGLALSREPGSRGKVIEYGFGQDPSKPCDVCKSTGCPWDRLGYDPRTGDWKTICPDCQQEAVVSGTHARFHLVWGHCVCCDDPFTGCRGGFPRKVTPVLTFPLHTKRVLRLEFCAAHFHEFVGRRLGSWRLIILHRRLHWLGVCPRRVFLLHEAFYDHAGKALQPVEMEL